ncbi:YybS family protein [Metabacillus sp. 84]|uniref:YybS family protein n=1 Tax=Metabacillus sp. 84 TaxID=3404705 RepID=UPI003CF892B9
MKRTNALTEGAIMLALFTVLVFITLTVPLLGSITLLALPLPLIVYAGKHEFKNNILLAAASVPIVFLLGSVAGLSLSVPAALIGLIMGTLYRKRGSAAAVIGASFGFLLSILAGYMVSILFFQINPLQEFETIMKQSVDQAIGFLEMAGQKPEEEQITQMRTQMDQLFTIFPSILIGVSFFSAIILHAIASPILRRLKLKSDRLKPFRDWRLPQSIAWYYIAVMILSFIDFEKGSFMETAVTNLFTILLLLLVMQGLSFVFYYAFVKEISRGIPVLVVVFSLFFPFLLYPVQFLGIIDIGFRLRERITPKS